MPRRASFAALLCGGLLAGAGLGLGCPPPQRLPLEVEYAGCSQVFLPGPVCALEKHRKLRFWVGQPPEVPVEIRAGWRRLKSAGVAVQGGQRFAVEIPPWASRVELRAATPQGEAAWSLALAALREEPGVASSRQARDALGDGNLAAARRLLVRALAAHHAAGAVLDEADDVTVLAWIEIQERRFAAVRQALSRLRLPAGSPAEAVYFRSHYSGLLADQVGDARSALVHLDAAVRQAERVDLRREVCASEQVRGRQLQMLGRSREAVALFDRLRRTCPRELPRDLTVLLTNQAWAILLAGEAGLRLRDPIPLLDEARRAVANADFPEADQHNDLLNRALAHLQAGRLARARAALSVARSLERFATTVKRLWSLELEARLELAEGRPETALQLYKQMEELAATAQAPEDRWRAAYGRARCHRALGRRDEALAALAEAESRLEEQSLQIPIHEGRETFAAQREGATRLYLELLLERSREAEALEVVRRSRSRVLRQLARGDRLAHLTPAEQRRWDDALAAYWDQRALPDADAATDWELPADRLSRRQEARAAQYQEAERALDRAFAVLGRPAEHGTTLPALHPGEVVLAYHPLSHGWVGFAADGRTVAVHRFELPARLLAEPRELAARLLAPFRAAIERARRVRVLPYGILRTVDFHGLPFGKDILLAARPVVYGLDFALPQDGRPLPDLRALVVANPLGDLPKADLEAQAVAAALNGQQPIWSTEVLQGTGASAERVRRSLAGTALFHYAGHAIFSGSRGWESVLPLAGGTRMTLADLLALGQAPPWVVLSGCETGRSGAESPVEGLGLAHAFLLTGSRAVIAATRPVEDGAAQGLFADLYRSWSATPDLAALLREAQLAWRQRDPDADWESFRVFEP